jgi:hypothetical protein
VVKLPPRCSHVRGNHESLGAGYVEEAAPKCRSIEEGENKPYIRVSCV